MDRKWEVVAVYIPLPRVSLTLPGRYRPSEREEVVPVNGGREWKFTVIVNSAVEAVEAVKQSGYFCGELAKQFGFTVTERA